MVDIDFLKILDVLAGNCGGEEVLNELEVFLVGIRTKFSFAPGSEDERRFIGRLADASNILRGHTFSFITEFLEDYPELYNGDLDGLLHMITFSVPLFRLVQFHEDYELLVADNKLGKVNNECYYVSLRDLVQSVHMLTRRLDYGMEYKEAMKRAIVRRYYNRCSTDEDRMVVKKLMIKHFIVTRKDGLSDYIYDFEGLDQPGEDVVVWERERESVHEEFQREKREYLRLTRPREYVPQKQTNVLSEHIRKNASMLLEALESDSDRVNPVLL